MTSQTARAEIESDQATLEIDPATVTSGTDATSLTELSIDETRVLNLTPHRVVYRDDNSEEHEYAQSGEVASVSERIVGRVRIPSLPIAACRVEYSEVSGLPEPSPDVYLIVADAVRCARPNRFDLLSPYDLVHDQNGVVTHCRSFRLNTVVD